MPPPCSVPSPSKYAEDFFKPRAIPLISRPPHHLRMMLAVEDIGDDPIALATRGKHCLNEIVSYYVPISLVNIF